MHNPKLTRRAMLGSGAAMGASLASGVHADEVTPAQPEGPFYPTLMQADRDADLTRVDGQSGIALGEIVDVSGIVTDLDGVPIEGAIVDIWQANAAGRYVHERDPNPAPLDPNFQGWAVMTTDAEGRYGFRTVRPGAYPAGGSWMRPPHIHYRVSKRGFHELTTQMYFAGETLNTGDRLLAPLSPEEQARLIAERAAPDAPYQFDITLAPV